MITYNGNEMMLQNDMGNTLILDSATGNIMGLNPGFIPIGMKEHGGIMYIASVDKNGNGEIGTIPSPIIRDIYKDKVTFEVNQSIPINTGDPIRISNKLYPADKFIVNLQMEIEKDENNKIQGADVLHKDSALSSSNSSDPSDFILKRSVAYQSGSTDIYTPLISYAPDFTDLSVSVHEAENSIDLFSTKGIYKMSLLSTNTNGQKVEDSLTNCLVYGDSGDRSKYWFTHSNFISDIFPKDLLMATLNSDLKQFPSSNKPGELAIILETESVGKFDILPRKDGLTVPITFKDSTNYTTYFPGFYYSTDSGLYIDKLSNIKIIDESTSKDILHNISSIEFKNYKLENINDPVTIGEKDESIEVWQGDYLPQTKTSDKENPNTFILSNIKSIINHTETNLRSSTKGMDESPHTGVITVNLGEKYNNWYRLELDYYDLYGEKQGMFTKRFNPYLNDVFGTNLRIEGKVNGEKLTIGNKLTLEKFSDTQTRIINAHYYSKYPYVGTTEDVYSRPSGVISDYPDLFNPFVFLDGNEDEGGYDSDYTTLIHSGNRNQQIKLTVPNKDLSALLHGSPLYVYDLSSIDTGLSSYSFSFDTGIPTFQFKRDEYGTGWYLWVCRLISNAYAEEHWFYGQPIGDKTFYTEHVWFSNELHPIGGGHIAADIQKVFPKKIYFSDENGKSFVDYPTLNDVVLTDDYFKQFINTSCSMQRLGLNYNIVFNGLLDENIYTGFSALWRGGYKEFISKAMYIRKDFTEGTNYKWHAQIDFPFTFTVVHDAVSILPHYSIIPYFCITGITEKGDNVYIQRFGNEEGTDIVYLHNFEYDNRGEIKNYFYNDFKKLMPSEVVQCSYNHETPFYYSNEKLDYNHALSPGIYILNIVRVPGKATASDQFNHGVSLSIKIGEDEKIFKDIQWAATPDYYNMNNGLGETDNLIYRPIVLIIQSAVNVRISTDVGFHIQNIGLFKISGVNDSQSIIQLLGTIKGLSNIMFYDDYMYELEHLSVNFGKIEKYNFIQKYGVFFKEAYVFIDGLIDTNDVISGVTVGDNEYGSYPYIPSDPSILPVHLSTEGEYIWNAYVMPRSVLYIVNDDYPDFVFSNPLDWQSFSTKPDSDNLRQLIE